jgi:hypothetical protein
VADLPDDVADADAAAGFVNRIRRQLARRYPGLPWPKRLGTYTVLLCRHEVAGRLGAEAGRLIDYSGLHVNVLLGTVLVDMEAFRAHSDTTWGLIDTGEQFKRIQDAVESWCRRYRRPARLMRKCGRLLSVA